MLTAAIRVAGSISELFRERGWPLEEFAVERGRLDEVFRQITQADAADEVRS